MHMQQQQRTFVRMARVRIAMARIMVGCWTGMNA